jgi:hypothetical protein
LLLTKLAFTNEGPDNISYIVLVTCDFLHKGYKMLGDGRPTAPIAVGDPADPAVSPVDISAEEECKPMAFILE